MVVHEAEVHLAEAPCGAADAVLLESFAYILIPLKCISRLSQVDNTVLSAVKRNVSFLCDLNCLAEILVEIFHTQALGLVESVEAYRNLSKHFLCIFLQVAVRCIDG